MNFPKVWLIARREFIYNLGRKSYLFSAFVVPILISILSYFSFYVVAQKESDVDQFQAVGYVNQTTALKPPENTSDDSSVRFLPFADEAEARARFDMGEIQAYFVIPADYLKTGQVIYYSDIAVREALAIEFSDFLQVEVARLNPQPTTERLIDPLTLEIQFIDAAKPVSQETAFLQLAFPIALGFLFVFNILITSQFLMTGIVEEKENYILEILISSCRPLELITGKVLGLGGLALLQLTFWLTMGLGISTLNQSLDAFQSAHVETKVFLLAAIYFVLTFLLFAGVMIGIGSIASAEQESRQITSFIVMIAVLPVILSIELFGNDPNSAWVTALSLFPLTAPLSIMILLGLGEADTWQIGVSLILLMVSIVGVLWLAGYAFRVSMLAKGQPFSLKNLRQLLRG